MFITAQNRIALISVDGDPAVAIGQEEAGGQNVYVRQVGEALAELGWQVDMFTRRSSIEQPAVVQHGPQCRTIRLAAGPPEFMTRDNLFEHLPEFIRAFQDFQQREGFQYSLVHTNYWLSAWVGMQLKKRQPLVQVHTYHSLGAVKYQSVTEVPRIAAQRLAVEKSCLETVDRVVATSPQEAEHMRSLVSSQGAIEMIPCGTDIAQFGTVRRSAARQQLGIAPNAKLVFYVGRFDQRKGIETLARAVAMSEHRRQGNLQLIIGGGSRPGKSDGIERERIEELVADLDLTELTTFPGRIEHSNLSLYYAAADVCVVPSHYEPFGLVAIEAMASRTPVVASQVGGLRYTVVSGVTGFLVPPQDEIAFATAIDRVLALPRWRDHMGELGRHRVEAMFSWTGVATRLSDLYTQLLSQAPSQTAPVAVEATPPAASIAIQEPQIAA
ncbi:Glycosyl transferase, group 1 [uncultured Synechococcales cyanobacterium]|uniref:Glycosyl transferase, group 1 n=1 Tax=uncultured Synechococcales cyanobacterium TaxID=1936017 RepID=A0A6J4VEL8_9CYAN|nr:Glycosyl transferase, group 1 [uncultured Synechococcales cyanobacterium]